VREQEKGKETVGCGKLVEAGSNPREGEILPPPEEVWLSFRAREETAAASIHFSLAYSALAATKMGMSGSASFHRVRKS
jgi:hypothetical protein